MRFKERMEFKRASNLGSLEFNRGFNLGSLEFNRGFTGASDAAADHVHLRVALHVASHLSWGGYSG